MALQATRLDRTVMHDRKTGLLRFYENEIKHYCRIYISYYVGCLLIVNDL